MTRSLKRVVVTLGLVLLIVAATATAVAASPVAVSPMEQLGAEIAFDAKPPGAGWAPPEVPETVNIDELGDLGLTKREELALVAFMKTLSDRAFMPQPAH